jgi:peptide deformylase
MIEDFSGKVELRYWPNPVLSEVAEPLTDADFGPELEAFGNRMIALMQKAGDGVGLAATQVGLLKQFFVMEFTSRNADPSPPAIICNPVILEESKEGEYASEGCLSLPGVFQHVWRPSELFVGFQTPTGESKQMVVLGLEARIVAHEIDHLHGRMFFDSKNMPRRDRKAVESEWAKKGAANIAASQRRLSA